MTRTDRRSWFVRYQTAGVSSHIDGCDLCRAFCSERRPLILSRVLSDEKGISRTRIARPVASPEDEAMFEAEFAEIMKSILSEPIGLEAGESLQDWLRGQGAVIPDAPEWKTLLYLDKWVRTASDPS